MTIPKVRFAPSPTGFLHIGGLRTALLNYMYAKKNGGTMVLRIEDTDTERSKREYEEYIIDSLKWAGVSWDEFYRQSERMERYNFYFEKLLEEEKAYRCFCEKEEEDGSCGCSSISKEESEKRAGLGEKHTIKLKFSGKDYIVKDRIKGNVEFKKENFKDFIIKKSDGMPVFHFAVVVDDYEMGIYLIIRGEDHLSNTPRHIMIYEAIGAALPEYAHVALMLGEDKTRLSKRHGVVSIDNFIENGIIKEALVNYLLVLGFSQDEENEFLTLKEAVEKFDLAKMSTKATVFSYQKLSWFNKSYLTSKGLDEVTAIFSEYIKKYKLLNVVPEYDKLKEILAVSKDRVSTLKELLELNRFFFEEPASYDEKGAEKFLKGEEAKRNIAEFYEILKAAEWTMDGIGEAFKKYAEEKGIGLNKVVQPIRLLITGKMVSPGLFESICILGKERSFARIEKFIRA